MNWLHWALSNTINFIGVTLQSLCSLFYTVHGSEMELFYAEVVLHIVLNVLPLIPKSCVSHTKWLTRRLITWGERAQPVAPKPLQVWCDTEALKIREFPRESGWMIDKKSEAASSPALTTLIIKDTLNASEEKRQEISSPPHCRTFHHCWEVLLFHTCCKYFTNKHGFSFGLSRSSFSYIKDRLEGH